MIVNTILQKDKHFEWLGKRVIKKQSGFPNPSS